MRSRAGQPSDQGDPATTSGRTTAPDAEELGAPLPGQRIRTRAARPPVDPRLLRFDPAVGRLLVGSGLLAAVTAAALIAQATALAAIVARTFLGDAHLADHRAWLWLLLAAVAVRAGATWATDVVAQRTSARVKSRLRTAVIDRVTRRAPGEGDDATGELTSALTDGIDALDGTFGGYLPALVSGVIVPVMIVGWLVGVDVTSAAVLAVTLPLIPVFMVLIGLAARSATRRRFRALTALSGQLLAVLQGLTTIRVARATGRIGAVVREAGERLRRTTLETLRIAFLSALALELLAALAVATVAVIAGVRLAQGTGVAFEAVLVALLLAPEAFLPLRRVGQQFHANEDGAAAAERLLDLLETPTREPEGRRRPAPDPAHTRLRFERVSVTHPGRPLPALDRIDLALAPGAYTAVLGASGAGKTTLAAVLLGLRQPDGGRLLVGNVEVAELAPEAWQERIAWVPQAPADLAGSVRELVTLGHPGRNGTAGDGDPSASDAADLGVSDDEVWDALVAVGMDAEVAALPAGLDTPIGPGGRGLSAGQRRRLAIARALVRPAGLLVLDEPTGDLDVEAEQAVRTTLASLRGDRTVVVLTHRVALAAEADQVVVLDDGRVAEHGPPPELRDRGGAYAALVAAARPIAPAELSSHLPATLGSAVATSAPVAAATPAPDPVPDPVPDPGADPGLGPSPDPGPDLACDPVRDHRCGPPRRLVSLRTLFGPSRRSLVIAVTAGALTPLAGVVLVSVSTYLISRAALQPNLLDLTVVIVAVRALSLVKGTSRYVERLSGHDVALRTVVDLRVEAYERLVPLVPAGLGRHREGDVLARIVADVDRLQLALVRGVVPLIGGLLASVTVVLIVGLLLPAASVVAAVGLAATAIGVPLLAARLAHRPEQALARARGRLSAELIETLQAAPELRLLGQLGPARRRIDDLDAEVVRRDRSSVARGGGADALVQFGLGLTGVGLILVGVPAVARGAMDGVLLGALVVLAFAAVEAVGPLPASAKALVTARIAARRLRQVLDTSPPAPDPVVSATAAPPLAVDRVTARYPRGSVPALRELELQLSPGHRVAVVGRSGSGKSTLANLAVRFLDPERGELRLGGHALTGLAGDEVRRHVTLAPQDAHVFEGTIASNLRLVAPDASDEALHAVLAAAHLDAWVVELPDGLETTVGERGARLSGGQRHRVALARTLLAGAPLLVLDEPTADLDPVTGRAFLLDTLVAAEERGVLLLTHDLRALPVVDEVVVLEAGRVVARGRHADLLASDPIYAARWRLSAASDTGSGARP